MTTRTLARLAAAATAAALLLAGCTQPAGDDPAAKAAIAYYTSRDTRTAEQCDFEWSYRSDPTKLASCKADPGGGYSSITGMQVLRTVDFPGPDGGPGKALAIAMTLKEGSAVYAVAMAEADGRWFWVKEESPPKAPATDDELIAALS